MKKYDFWDFVLVTIIGLLIACFFVIPKFGNNFDVNDYVTIEKNTVNGGYVNLTTVYGDFSKNYDVGQQCSSLMTNITNNKTFEIEKTMIYNKVGDGRLFMSVTGKDKYVDLDLNTIMCLFKEYNFKIFVKKDILERKIENSLNNAVL